MSTPRKNYTAAEKGKIALEALKGSLTQNELTSKYAVHSTQIAKWKKQLSEGVTEIFSEKRRKKDILVFPRNPY